MNRDAVEQFRQLARAVLCLDHDAARPDFLALALLGNRHQLSPHHATHVKADT